MATPLPRPRQVQIAGWLIIVGSLLSLVATFDQVHALGSLEMAEEIERQLERPMFDGISVSIDQVESWIKALSIVGAVCSSTMAIVAWQMLRERSATARLWLTVLAVPAFFTGMVGDSFFTTMVVVSVGLLWTLPARQWFAGTWKPEPASGQRPGAERRTVASRDAFSNSGTAPAPVREKSPGNAPQPPPSASWPPPAPSSAAPPAPSSAAPPAYGPLSPASPAGPVPAPTATSGAVAPRPSAVMGAAALTWVFSLISAVSFVTLLTVAAIDPDRIMDEMRQINPELMAQEEITIGMVQLMFAFLAGVVVIWTASACTLAFLVVRRVAWARMVLVVCAAVAALVLLVAALASPVMLAPFIAAAVTVGLLLRRDVTAWLTRP